MNTPTTLTATDAQAAALAVAGIGDAVRIEPAPEPSRVLAALLVVHNDSEAAGMLMALRRGGFSVRHMRVSDEAMLRQELDRAAWDVVIAANRMPAWGGLDVLRLVQAQDAHLPVVLVYGEGGASAAIDAIREGARDCIHRNELADRLPRSVAQAVERRQRERRTAQIPSTPASRSERALLAIAALPVAVYDCDAGGHILGFNAAAASLWGREPQVGIDQWTGAPQTFMADGRPLAPADGPMASCLRTGARIDGTEILVERQDGSRRHVRHHVQPLRDAQGQLTGAINVVLDLTERKHQERRLLLSDESSRSMFDNNPAACMLNVPGGTITSVNRRFVELSGYSKAEVLGRRVDELDMWVGDTASQQTARTIRETHHAEALEVQILRKDGQMRRVLVSTTKVNVGGIDQLLHSLVDLTEQRLATEQARLAREALAAVSQGVLICGADKRILSTNQAFSAMTGYDEQDLIGSSCAVLQGPDSNAQTIVEMRRALNAKKTFQGDILNYRKDGSTFWNALSIDPVHDEQGQLTHFVGIVRDVTDSRAQKARLDLAQQIFTQSREGLLVADARRQIMMVNSAFTSITGYAQQEVLGANPRMLSAQRHDDRFYREMWANVMRLGNWQGEVWNRHKSGAEYLERLTINVLRDHTGQISHYIGTFSDITEQRAAQEKIEWLSHFDPLTQLPNRDLLADRCAHDLHLLQREEGQMTVIVLNIDRLKLINETLGFSAGNKVIKKFARRLARAVRAQDTVARLGSDEFALLLPGETPEGACQMIERLQTVLSEPFGVGDQEAQVSASIGLALFPNDGDDFESLFKAAQTAMYRSKEKGGNQHCFYSAGMSEESTRRLAIGKALRSAIQNEELHLVYQPFVDLQTGGIIGMEALLRWNHPELGALSPALFIPLAEQSGQIVAIGAWVLQKACLDLQQWRSIGLATVPVSVNLSPVQFRDPGLLDMVRSTLQSHDIDASQICLELTEGAVMDDVAHSEQIMRAFKEIGVKLSLDDFGTGYSSLSYLKRFPFDKVKIDQSFVRDINTNNHDAVIAKVVISMAHGLGLRVIAEGVETEVQCEFLRRNVCDEIQGYFFSRPVTAALMAEQLKEDRRLPAHLIRIQTKERTVLLVDDEPHIVAALKRLLRPDGYRILSADSGPEGLAMLASHPVDIIVADQRMPGMTGVQFLREAKRLHPQTIRIVLSGHTELQSVTDAINEGAVYRFMTKPWDDEQLRGFIDQAFRHKELADENQQLSLKVMTANQELASSNRQLQEVLAQKQRALLLGEHNLDVMRETLMSLALPVLAIDDDGLIAYANAQAEELFGSEQALLAQKAAARLPGLRMLNERMQPGGPAGYEGPDGKTYLVHRKNMGSMSQSKGTVITFIPAVKSIAA
jgi:diguanylate cyclase (GGDEF)-like protein/PAS domain S-box-containing protein